LRLPTDCMDSRPADGGGAFRAGAVEARMGPDAGDQRAGCGGATDGPPIIAATPQAWSCGHDRRKENYRVGVMPTTISADSYSERSCIEFEALAPGD
jgi:hypothetical protein